MSYKQQCVLSRKVSTFANNKVLKHIREKDIFRRLLQLTVIQKYTPVSVNRITDATTSDLCSARLTSPKSAWIFNWKTSVGCFQFKRFFWTTKRDSRWNKRSKIYTQQQNELTASAKLIGSRSIGVNFWQCDE